MFRRYHYLSSVLATASHNYLATINDRAVAFVSVMRMPHPIAKDIMRVHRIVVHPDYQGIGIGGRLLDFLGEKYAKDGERLRIVTSTPALIHTFKNNTKWKCVRAGRLSRGGGTIHSKKKEHAGSYNRFTTSWEFKP